MFYAININLMHNNHETSVHVYSYRRVRGAMQVSREGSRDLTRWVESDRRVFTGGSRGVLELAQVGRERLH